MVMIDHLPPYLRGLMVAAFAAAYMSTIATQLNWGASYLINDFYRRFVNGAASEQHYVRASQLATVLITVVSAVVTFYMDSIAGAWKLLILTGAGTGLVLLLRWYWWRINAWSEVSAMISAFVVSVAMQTVFGFDSARPVDEAWIMIITVAITTVVWLAVTFLTRAGIEGNAGRVLSSHRAVGYRMAVRSRRLAPDIHPRQDGMSNLLDWICGCVLIYGVLFGVGKLLLQETAVGAGLIGYGRRGGRDHLLGPVAPRLGFGRGLERQPPPGHRHGLLLAARLRPRTLADGASSSHPILNLILVENQRAIDDHLDRRPLGKYGFGTARKKYAHQCGCSPRSCPDASAHPRMSRHASRYRADAGSSGSSLADALRIAALIPFAPDLAFGLVQVFGRTTIESAYSRTEVTRNAVR